MPPTQPATGAPYHRLARTAASRWWRPLVGTLAVALLFGVLSVALFLLWYAIHEPQLVGTSAASVFDQAWGLGLVLLLLGAAVPTTLLVARLIDRRPAGSLSSVAAGIRWRWLAMCTILAAAVYALVAGVAFAIDPPEDIDWALLATVTAVAVVLVPLQAAGEEYFFRGYLPQAIGTYVRSPWVPALVISGLFGLAHGTLEDQGTWAFVYRSAFGLAAAWLTIRTGGLEGAIAIHVTGNVLAVTSLAAYGELQDYLVDLEEHAEAWEAALLLTVVGGLALVLERIARRRGIQTRWRAATSAPSRPAPFAAEKTPGT